MTSKAWREANKERIKVYRRQYYLAHHTKEIEEAKSWNNAHPEARRITNARRFVYKDKVEMMSAERRTGVCNMCRAVAGIDCKKTVLHHVQYEDSNPIAHTIEICQSCHDKIHASQPRKKTDYCKRGHPRTPENIIPRKDGDRDCSACRKINQAKYRMRKKSARLKAATNQGDE